MLQRFPTALRALMQALRLTSVRCRARFRAKRSLRASARDRKTKRSCFGGNFMLVCAWLPLTRAAAAQTPVSCCRRTSAAMRIATSYDRLFELPVGGTFVPAFLLHASRAASAPRLMPGTRANAACHCRGLFQEGAAGQAAGQEDDAHAQLRLSR